MAQGYGGGSMKNASSFDKPVAVPTPTGEAENVTYWVTIYPFSDQGVGVSFTWCKTAPGKFCPDGWVPRMETIRGPQVDGVDLDVSHVKIGPFFWSYREYIFSCLWGILEREYKGRLGMREDYKNNGTKHPTKNTRYVNLDRC